jgi:putative transposase
MQATKSVSQPHDNEVLRELLRRCLALTYSAVQYGKDRQLLDRTRMKGFYRALKGVNIPSCYKVASITRACSVLKSREKGEKRGRKVKHRKALRPMTCITTGFFTTITRKLFIALGRDRYEMVQLNKYVYGKISQPGVKVRSLTITDVSISFCYSKEVKPIPVRSVYGVDRNEKNLTFGNDTGVLQIGLSKIAKVKQMTREVVRSFGREDRRVRRGISRKYWKRANHRTGQLLHAATHYVVESAVEGHAALVVEDLTGINRMYRKRNGQGARYRFRLNSWPHRKTYDMLEYKSAWKGVTFIQLTRSETRGSSSTHTCGERLRDPAGDYVGHRRMLWCPKCEIWVDRDANAAVILSQRGLARLTSSLPRSKAQDLLARQKGPAGEAMMGNRMTPVVLTVDAGKLPSTKRATEPRTLVSPEVYMTAKR